MNMQDWVPIGFSYSVKRTVITTHIMHRCLLKLNVTVKPNYCRGGQGFRENVSLWHRKPLFLGIRRFAFLSEASRETLTFAFINFIFSSYFLFKFLFLIPTVYTLSYIPSDLIASEWKKVK